MAFCNNYLNACRYSDISWLEDNLHALHKNISKSELHEGLVRAIVHNNPSVVQWLINAETLHIKATHDANLPVQLACQYGYLDIAKWLVKESKHPVNVFDSEFHALLWAVENNHLDVTKWILLEAYTSSHKSAKCYVSNLQLNTNPKIIHELCDISADYKYEDIEIFLNAVRRCLISGLEFKAIQNEHSRLSLVEKDLDPAFVFSLSDHEVQDIVLNTDISQKTKFKLHI